MDLQKGDSTIRNDLDENRPKNIMSKLREKSIGNVRTQIKFAGDSRKTINSDKGLPTNKEHNVSSQADHIAKLLAEKKAICESNQVDDLDAIDWDNLNTCDITFRNVASIEPSQYGSIQDPSQNVPTMKTGQKRKPLRTCEEELDRLKSENMELKLRMHKLKSTTDHKTGDSLQDIQQDIVQFLEEEIRKLKFELENLKKEREREKMKAEMNIKDASCQTNLDSKNIDILLQDRITLKKYMSQIDHQQMQQPAVATYLNKQLIPEEKVLLEQLYRINGALTTAKDILKAKAEMKQI